MVLYQHKNAASFPRPTSVPTFHLTQDLCLSRISTDNTGGLESGAGDTDDIRRE